MSNRVVDQFTSVVEAYQVTIARANDRADRAEERVRELERENEDLHTAYEGASMSNVQEWNRSKQFAERVLELEAALERYQLARKAQSFLDEGYFDDLRGFVEQHAPELEYDNVLSLEGAVKTMFLIVDQQARHVLSRKD